MQGMSGNNEQLTDNRFIRGTKAALQCPWLLTNGPAPIHLCKPLSCKVFPKTILNVCAIGHFDRFDDDPISFFDTQIAEGKRIGPVTEA